MEMITLTTPRLTIVALDLNNLYHYVNNYGEVQRNLGLNVTMENQDREIQYVFREAHYNALNDPENYFWYTSWEMILTAENTLVGGLCFKGPPDEAGDVEVGYSVEDAYWNLGYATEGLTTLLDWVNANHPVNFFTASTEPENLASQSVLKKLGFEAFKTARGLIWWRKKSK